MICDAFRNLLPFLQFKKREKYPCKSIAFNNSADFSLERY